MSPILDAILSGLDAAGYALDTPGALMRGVLAGRPGERMDGRGLLEEWGVLDENREGLDGGDVAGFAADMLLDPLNLVGGGLLGKAMSGASKAKQSLRGTGYFDEAAAAVNAAPASHGWDMIDTVGDDTYMQARAIAGRMPRKHPMLRVPLDEARRSARGMSEEDFVFGPAKADPLPMPARYGLQDGEWAPLDGPPPDALQQAWDALSSRYPGSAANIRMIGERPELVDRGWRGGLGVLPDSYGGTALFTRPNAEMFGPVSMLHELQHAAQQKLGRFTSGMDRPTRDLTLEPTAWRRTNEAEMAQALYGYAAQANRISPTLAALLASVSLQAPYDIAGQTP